MVHHSDYRSSLRLQATLGLFGLFVCACGTDDSEPATPPTSSSVPVVDTAESESPISTGSAPSPGVTTPSPTSVAPASSSSSPATTTDASTSAATSSEEDATSPNASDITYTDDSTNSAAPDETTSAPSQDDETTFEPPNNGDCAPTTDERKAVGYGAATTGGGDTTPVVVSTFAEAEAALQAYRSAFKAGTQSRLVIRYTGTFDFSSITDVCAQHTKDSRILNIKEMENVTFEGAPGSSANFGIKINRAKNVIVRNMTMGLLPGGGDSDAITIEGNGTNGDVEHVWIDHNDLFSSTKDDCSGAGDTEFDGLIDIKKGARYITISYNHLHDHQKTGLLGSSDSDDMDRYVTFHHNWYENVVSRTPLHRFGYIHMYNNYFNRILDSGINVRMGGVALIESNYFENVSNPITSRYSSEAGFWELRNNHVGANIKWSRTADTLANADDWKSTTTFPARELTYDYAPDSASCVKQIVSARAGATLK